MLALALLGLLAIAVSGRVSAGPVEPPQLLFPWPRELPMWLTGGPHDGAYGINETGVPLATRNALDFARGPESWPVLAAAPGRVVRAGCRIRGSEGLGCLVEIDHGDGWQTIYGHLARNPRRDAGLTPGVRLPAGALIGHAGETGHAYGVHLHFELRQGGQEWRGGSWIPGRAETMHGKRIEGWTVRALRTNYRGILLRPESPKIIANPGCFWYPGSPCVNNRVESRNRMKTRAQNGAWMVMERMMFSATITAG